MSKTAIAVYSIVLSLVIIASITFIFTKKSLPLVNQMVSGTFPEETKPAQKELPRSPITFTVTIKDNRFIPDTVEIRINDSIRWMNEDEALHWPASDPHPTHTNLTSLDALGEMQKGESYTHTFRQAGTFTYHDHASALKEAEFAKGKIVVKP